MLQPITLLPGVTLRCYTDHRFKQGCLSLQLVRPMKKEEAALNALLPAVLLRGCEGCADMRQITLRLDDLYGAGMGALVRRIGDYQTTGISCSFIEDRYAFPGDQVFAPMAEFLYRLLRQPCTEQGVFVKEYVEGEKKNLLAAIDSQKNDKRLHAANRLRQLMCADDSFGVPRLGDREQVASITPEQLWTHYQKVLRDSPVELFYVGSREPAQVAEVLTPLFQGLDRQPVTLPPQKPLNASAPGTFSEEMEVSQGKLAMGFTTNINNQHGLFVPMQVLMLIFGGSTGKLFNVIREKMSLCYDIGATYYGSKGFMTVAAGIDFDKETAVRQEVLNQLQQCCRGAFTEAEFSNAKVSLISQLQAAHDSPGAIEGYYSNAALSGHGFTVQEYICRVEQVTVSQVLEAAKSLQLNTVFFLKGVQA